MTTEEILYGFREVLEIGREAPVDTTGNGSWPAVTKVRSRGKRSKGDLTKRGLKQAGINDDVSVEVFINCFYHLKNEKAFTRDLSSEKEQQSVEELVNEVINKDGHLDAVVIRTEIDNHWIGKGRCKTVEVVGTDCYDIYLPPPEKK